jgi:hypothetical protein
MKLTKEEVEYIKGALEFLRDNTEVANHNRTFAETFFNVITNSLQILDGSNTDKLKKEYNLETYGKMTDYDRKQLWEWIIR